MKVMMSLTVLVTLTTGTCLLLSPVNGNSLIRRMRGERARRQGYTPTELERQTEVHEELFTAERQKPEVPTLYAIPRASDQSTAEEPRFEESESLNQGNDGQVTTTEVTTHPFEDASQPSKGIEEGVSEDYQLVTVTESSEKVTPQGLVSMTTEALIGSNSEGLSPNGIKTLKGYSSSSSPPNFYDPRIRSNFKESEDEHVQEPRVNLIGNYIPPSANEIPQSYTSRPIDQQQVENSYHHHHQHQHQHQQYLPQLQRYQHPQEEQEVFEQFAALHQPTRNQYELRQETPRSHQGHGKYNFQEQAFNTQRFNELKEMSQPIGKDHKIESLNTNMIDTTGSMSLEGLGSEIVDAKLLERVQQIIEDHEREQKEYLFRLQENQAQLPVNSNQNGKIDSFLQPNKGDSSERVQGTQYPQNTTPHMERTQNQQTQSPNYFSQQGLNFFRERKSFPGNSNLEFQPAILTGHFVETKTERLQEENKIESNQFNSNQNVYLPPNQKLTFQNEQRRKEGDLTSNYYQRSEQSNLQHQQDSKLQNPQQQQQQHEQQHQPQSNYFQQEENKQTQNHERFHQSELLMRPYNLPISEMGSQFSLDGRREEAHSTTMTHGYENKRPELLSFQRSTQMEEVQTQNYVEGRQTPNPYFHNSEKSNEEEDRKSLARGHVSSTGEKKEVPQYLPPKHEQRPIIPHPFESTQFNGGGINSIRGNPNIITRTIVIHETPVGAGNPEGLTNRAIIRVSDLEGRGEQRGHGITSSILRNYKQPMREEGNEVGNPSYPQQQQQQQFRFLAASANLKVQEENGRPRNTIYNTLPSSQQSENSESFEQRSEVEKPRPVYGIPIAPVLGPESISDSVVIDANQRHGGMGSNSLNIGNDGATDQNVFALYRLPNSDGMASENRNRHTAVPSFDAEVAGESSHQRGGVIPSNSYGVANVITKRNVQSRFFPALVSPLAGSFSIKSTKF